LLAAKAHAGTKKNKTTLRNIDRFITISNRRSHIEQSQRICKGSFFIEVQISVVAHGVDSGSI
jgi:hypothetical protein